MALITCISVLVMLRIERETFFNLKLNFEYGQFIDSSTDKMDSIELPTPIFSEKRAEQKRKIKSFKIVVVMSNFHAQCTKSHALFSDSDRANF